MKRVFLLWASVLQALSPLAAAIPRPLLIETSSVAHDSVEHDIPDSSREFRPNLDKVVPDVIKFGVVAKQISDVNLIKGTFNADLVVTLRWRDTRANWIARQVKATSVTMPTEVASRKMWLPNVKISNRDQHGVDVVSTAVTVDSDGNVEKVDRLLADMHTPFETTLFPFDTQELCVRLASESLMSDELVLSPMLGNSTSGVLEHALAASNFDLDSWRSNSIVETDATLRKSRGQLIIRVRRRSWPHIQSLIAPELLVLTISCSVFWLPPLAPFVMPRVATALISFLTLTTLGLRTNAMIPTRGGLAWIDLFETSCQSIVLFALVNNIVVLVVFHSFEEEDIGYLMDRELSLYFPIVALFICAVVFHARDGANLALWSFCNSLVCIGATIIYLLATIWRVRHSMRQKKAVAEPIP